MAFRSHSRRVGALGKNKPCHHSADAATEALESYSSRTSASGVCAGSHSVSTESFAKDCAITVRVDWAASDKWATDTSCGAYPGIARVLGSCDDWRHASLDNCLRIL